MPPQPILDLFSRAQASLAQATASSQDAVALALKAKQALVQAESDKKQLDVDKAALASQIDSYFQVAVNTAAAPAGTGAAPPAS
jgi:hypothetical protein